MRKCVKCEKNTMHFTFLLWSRKIATEMNTELACQEHAKLKYRLRVLGPFNRAYAESPQVVRRWSYRIVKKTTVNINYRSCVNEFSIMRMITFNKSKNFWPVCTAIVDAFCPKQPPWAAVDDTLAFNDFYPTNGFLSPSLSVGFLRLHFNFYHNV